MIFVFWLQECGNRSIRKCVEGSICGGKNGEWSIAFQSTYQVSGLYGCYQCGVRFRTDGDIDYIGLIVIAVLAFISAGTTSSMLMASVIPLSSFIFLLFKLLKNRHTYELSPDPDHDLSFFLTQMVFKLILH